MTKLKKIHIHHPSVPTSGQLVTEQDFELVWRDRGWESGVADSSPTPDAEGKPDATSPVVDEDAVPVGEQTTNNDPEED